MQSPFVKYSLRIATLSLLAIITAVHINAADGTWTFAGSGSWDTDTNWSGSTIANGSGFTATFGPILGTAGNYVISVDTARTIGNLSFQGVTGSTNNFILSGSQILTLASGSTPTITVNLPSRAATISATLDGTQGLSLASGNLTLSGNNIYTGVTTVTSGILTIGGNNALGATGTGNTTTVTNSGTLILATGVKVTGETINLNSANSTSGSLQASGTAEWAGNIVIDSSNARIGTANSSSQLTVSGVIGNGASNNLIVSGLGTTVVSAVNTYTGNTTLYRGTLKLDGGNNRLPAGTAFSMGGTADASTFNLNGRNQQVTRIVDSSNTSNRTITNTSETASTLTLDGTVNASFANTGITGITGNLSLVKDGSFNQTLAKVNTYTGNTTINAGTLTLADDATMTFFIGANGVNNRILGTGSLALNGDFIFNLTNAVAIPGNSWLIADMSTLLESIGATFTVKDFTKVGSIWMSGDYQFSETSGILSYGIVIPEPSSCAVLAGAAALGACCFLRRRRHN